MSYQSAYDYQTIDKDYLIGRCHQSRRLAPNTYLKRIFHEWVSASAQPFTDGKDVFVVRLYNTNILTYYANGDIEFTTGGWDTILTRNRLHVFSPGRVESRGRDHLPPVILFRSATENVGPTLFYDGIRYNQLEHRVVYRWSQSSTRLSDPWGYGWLLLPRNHESIEVGHRYQTAGSIRVPYFPTVTAALREMAPVCAWLRGSDHTHDTLAYVAASPGAAARPTYLIRDFQVLWTSPLNRVLALLGFDEQRARQSRTRLDRACERLAKLTGLTK